MSKLHFANKRWTYPWASVRIWSTTYGHAVHMPTACLQLVADVLWNRLRRMSCDPKHFLASSVGDRQSLTARPDLWRKSECNLRSGKSRLRIPFFRGRYNEEAQTATRSCFLAVGEGDFKAAVVTKMSKKFSDINNDMPLLIDIKRFCTVR